MYSNKRLEEFEKSVNNKYKLYNTLFLNLPYRKVRNIGMLIPLLSHFCDESLKHGKEPLDILDEFFEKNTELKTVQDQQDFMLRVIQYVEREIVLYDSVEDAAFTKIQDLGEYLGLTDFLNQIKTKKEHDEIGQFLKDFSVRIVFTAHPTQFYSPAVLEIISKLRKLITADKIEAVDKTLQQLGLTSLINAKKPTPLDEAKNIIYFLRNVYYDSVAEMYTYVKHSLNNPNFSNSNIVKLGFWPGGDRDGNPFVTSKITRQVADELRTTLMKCYYNDVKALGQKITFRNAQELLSELREDLYDCMFNPAKTIAYQEIIARLTEVKTQVDADYYGLYSEDVELLIDKVNIFKNHFATLDIRQDHSMHYKLVEEILIHNGIVKAELSELSSEELVDALLNKSVTVDGFTSQDDVLNETLLNVKQLSTIQALNGEEGCNRYIISNSEDIFSVLFVMGLFRWSGYDLNAINFDIVPLFETMKGMADSREVMQTLFDIPAYRTHVNRRSETQTIMLGFSDGTKDGGYLKSNWSIFKTKENLSTVCQENGIKAIFFDGRGGPPSRGGGKSHRFYAAHSDDIANNEIQLTIQGQTITSTYGTSEQFTHNVEQMMTAALYRKKHKGKNDIKGSERELMETMAQLSFDKYTDLKNHPNFLPYLEEKSTLKYYGKANIGSRPAKRGGTKKLEFSDLRAISFVGSWSQLKQYVPGYYGIGFALNALKNQGHMKELQKMFKTTPLFKALILNSMASVYKCRFELTSYMKRDETFGDFWQVLFDEFNLAEEMMLEVSGYETIMEEEPITKNSIRIRERIVLPLLVIQQYALQKIALDSEGKEGFEKIVTRSLYGNINASRNSA
jgi:phosphoenolpyruvate carboxylase